MEEKILSKLKNWADPLENILVHDSIPFWIIYRQMFLTNNFPNRFFKYSIKNLEKDYKENKIKNKKIISFLTRKAIKTNEIIKRTLRKKTKNKKTKSSKVLFYTQSDKIKGNNIGKIGNLINETKYPSYTLSYEPIEKNSFFKINNQPNMIYEYIDKNILKISKEKSKIINYRWKKISEKQKTNLLTIDGKSIYPFIKNELDFLFSKEFLELIISYYETHKKILKEENIKTVCAIGTGTFYPKTLFAAANKLDIITFILQHGICFGYLEEELLKNTKFAVFGKHSIRELEEEKINKKNAKIVGASIFEEIIPYLNKQKLNKNKIVTILTDGFYIYGLVNEKEYFNQIEKWIKQIKKIKDIKIIIKTHPEEKEHLEKYQNIIKNYKNIKLISTPGKNILYSVLKESNVTINFGSTVALESMILNKPVITITNFHDSKIVEFDKVIQRIKNSGASINLKKEEDISIPIEKVLKNNNLKNKMEKFIQDSCYKIDNKSSKRAAEFLEKTVTQDI